MNNLTKITCVLGGIFAFGVISYLIYNIIQEEERRHEEYDYKIYIQRKNSTERIFVKKDNIEIIDGVLYFKNSSPYAAITNFEIVPTK